MINKKINKKKIINDPVFGFISIQSELVFDLIEHPYFQRLRRIKQLGLSCLVFPGANHTRFEHAIGTTHLMRQAIAVLRNKGHEITNDEAEAVTIAILLHDIGHGPFSHVLENTLLNVSHEEISLMLMEKLNKEFNGRLSMAIEIFKNKHKKTYLHQLVASQLDMDRLDYLQRDSFFTGVTEGLVGIDRIIKMLNLYNDTLVVDAKGIYSIEKFLIARRLMYWQVYLHKAVVSAEFMLVNILRRARYLIAKGEELFAPSAFKLFLESSFSLVDFKEKGNADFCNVLEEFASLDDNDILTAVKIWQNNPDKILSQLSLGLINRKLFRIELKEKEFTQKKKEHLLTQIQQKYDVSKEDASYFLINGELINSAYNKYNENIQILQKSGKIEDVKDASDINLSALTKTVRKFFLCFPKELDF